MDTSRQCQHCYSKQAQPTGLGQVFQEKVTAVVLLAIFLGGFPRDTGMWRGDSCWTFAALLSSYGLTASMGMRGNNAQLGSFLSKLASQHRNPQTQNPMCLTW